jgi:sugar lactone lactonase YvrE
MKLGQTVLLQWDAKGNYLGTIVTPEQPANLTWGDKEYRTLYIIAITAVDRLETKTQGYVPYLEHRTAVRNERLSV